MTLVNDKKSDVTMHDFFKHYRENVPSKEITRAKYFEVLKCLGDEFRKNLLLGIKLHIPFIGSIRIEKYLAKPKYAGFDYKTYLATGEKVKKTREQVLEPYHPKLVWYKHNNFKRYRYCRFLLPSYMMKDFIKQFQEPGFHNNYVETI